MSRRAKTSTAAASAASEDSASALAAAEALLPLVRRCREEGERLRHVAPAMAEAARKAGLLHMYLPRGLGGRQLDPLTAFKIVEMISSVDGSIGWCVMIASVQSAHAGWLRPDIGRKIAGDPVDLGMAGSIRPLGRAIPVDGGYRVSGQWDFASGVHHATWVIAPSIIMNGDTPRRDAMGQPVWRIMWVPKADFRIVDTWYVVGLRGTGSHDFAIDDVFVPEAHSSMTSEPQQHPGVSYDRRLQTTWAWTATVANALGIARGALDNFSDLATTHATTMTTALLRDRPRVQAQVGEAEAMIGAARSYVFDKVGRLWELAHAESGGAALDRAVAEARLSITHGMYEARHAVDLVFHAAGTNAIYTRNPLERYFRDIHVAIQHGAALPVHMESAGKALLGLRPTDPGW